MFNNLLKCCYGAILTLAVTTLVQAQSKMVQTTLKGGYNYSEYQALLAVNAHTVDVFTNHEKPEVPEGYKRVKTYKDFGFDNAWELWMSPKNVAIISIRGSSDKADSWLANFYTAMIPAQGKLLLADKKEKEYYLTDDPRATVHAGWLLAMNYMEADVRTQIDSLHKEGIRDFYIVGHSQGGAIAQLLTAHLYELRLASMIPKDITFKTYSSASPKVGNLYFAYAYERLVSKDWNFNVVNVDDWVPELPFSIQTFDDFNKLSPFTNLDETIKKIKFPARMVVKGAYKKLSKSTYKAHKNYNKILGKSVSGLLQKNHDFVNQTANYSTNFARINNSVLLKGKSDHQLKLKTETNVFAQHSHKVYYDLAGSSILDEIVIIGKQ